MDGLVEKSSSKRKSNLVLREEQKSERAPFYMLEVFTKHGTNSEWCKQHIIEITGFDISE
jgi:hypothetical protein